MRGKEGIIARNAYADGVVRSESEDYGDDDVDDVLLERHRGLWWK